MKQNKLTIQNKIDLLISDMGRETFLELLHFVIEVMEDDRDVKILMVRRFFDTFLEFEEIVQYLYDGEVEKKGKIVTNLSVILLRKELYNKTILVVDDIRLHGRALEEVCDFLVDQCKCAEENIALKVFADNREAVKVKSKYHSVIEIAENVNENRWKKISSSIINSLYILGQPYVSHLPYCEIEFGTEESIIIENFILNDQVEEITTDIQRYYNVRVFLYFMEDGSEQELKRKMPFVEQNMIRIYIYDKLGKIVIVPYAFLKPFNLEGIVYYYNLLCEFGMMQENILSVFSTNNVLIEEDVYLARYLYSMEVYVTSMLTGIKFFDNREIRNIIWNKKVEKYNFGYSFVADSKSADLVLEKVARDWKGKYADYSQNSLQLSLEPDIEELIEKVKYAGKEYVSAGRFMESYIKLSGRRDEELANQDRKRMRGVEYLRLRRYLPDTAKEIWKVIISVVDSGRATLTVSLNKMNQKLYIDSLLFAGEQNFACNEPDLIYFIYPLLEYECLCQNQPMMRAVEMEDQKKVKGDLIKLILDSFMDLREIADDNEMKELKEKSVLQRGVDYYMSRYPVYEKDEKLRKILEMTRCYMKG